MGKRENKYQAELIKEIGERLPGCIVLKNDSAYRQGIPDLTVLHGKNWGALEVKRSAGEDFEPNQEYYLDKLNGMSFASVIHPENQEDVLNGLQSALQPRGKARNPKRQ